MMTLKSPQKDNDVQTMGGIAHVQAQVVRCATLHCRVRSQNKYITPSLQSSYWYLNAHSSSLYSQVERVGALKIFEIKLN